MQRLALILALALALVALPGKSVLAQSVTSGQVQQVPLLVFDQRVLFEESAYGKAIIAQRKAREEALIAENLRIETALETEEEDLTARRATLPAAEFRALADAFDIKVEGLRAAQRQKYVEITTLFEADQRALVDASLPIFRALMAEAGAVAVMDKSAVLMTLDEVDVTAAAIARLDAVIGDGSTLTTTPLPLEPVQP